MRYLDPRNDLTFKKVFGEHPDLLISFLNALMPFKDESEYIEKIEYLPTELVPETPFRKDSIVDVRCVDVQGRQFIVEMQMYWDDDFLRRVTFNASKAYVKQINKGKQFESLAPVYTLSLLNENFRSDGKSPAGIYYHHYSIVDVYDTNERIPGMEFVFIELPKFKPKTIVEKKMSVLWLRYLTEIKDQTRDSEVALELKENKYISKALDILEESSYSDAELDAYDRYWDAIMTYKTLMENKVRKGIEEGLKEAIQQGVMEERLKNAKRMKAASIDLDTICSVTGLTKEEVETI